MVLPDVAYPLGGGGFQHEPFLSIRKVDFRVEDAYKITVFLCTHQCRDAPSLLAIGLIKKELKRLTPIKTPSLEEVMPLSVPEPPPWVSDEPCTDDDFEDAIEPLTRVVYNNVTPEIEGKFEIEKRPVLNGLFRFTSFDAALRFSRDVVDLASAEKVSVTVVLVTV